MRYIHELEDWPNLKYSSDSLLDLLCHVRYKQGKHQGKMEQLGFDLQNEARLILTSEEIIKSSEIEGESLNKDEVRSSVAKKLGIETAGLVTPSREVDGVVDMMIDATYNHKEDLSKERLFGWHNSLFPTGMSGFYKIAVAEYRNDSKGPMQIVSGPAGQERIHFEAPEASKIEKEMGILIHWINNFKLDNILKSAIAHFWFLTIHPFDDGNGRIGRAILDKLLARSDGSQYRFYSMSSQIQKHRNEYYLQLESASKGSLDITAWIIWFLECFDKCLDSAHEECEKVLFKAKVWEHANKQNLNDRQVNILNRLLDGFKGNMNNEKYCKITQCHSRTAARDLKSLVDKHILITRSKGRGINYIISERTQ